MCLRGLEWSEEGPDCRQMRLRLVVLVLECAEHRLRRDVCYWEWPHRG